MRRIATDTLWSAVATAGSAFGQWLPIALLARWQGAEATGSYVLAAAVVTPLHLFAGLQLRSALATGRCVQADAAVALRLRSGLALLPLAVALCWIMGGAELALIGGALGLARCCDGVGETIQGRLLLERRFRAVAGYASLRCLAITVATAIACHLELGALGVAGLGIPAALFCLGLGEWRHRPATTGATVLTPLFLQVLPLGIVAALLNLGVTAPRLVLGLFADLSELGQFATLAVLITAAAQVTSSLGPPVQTRLAAHHLAGRRHSYRRLMAATCLAMALLGASVLLCCPWAGQILRVLYGPGYEASMAIALPLALGFAFDALATPAGWALTATGAWRVQPGIVAAAAVVAITVSVLLVPLHGAAGAAWGLAAGAGARAALAWVALLRSRHGSADMRQDVPG